MTDRDRPITLPLGLLDAGISQVRIRQRDEAKKTRKVLGIFYLLHDPKIGWYAADRWKKLICKLNRAGLQELLLDRVLRRRSLASKHLYRETRRLFYEHIQFPHAFWFCLSQNGYEAFLPQPNPERVAENRLRGESLRKWQIDGLLHQLLAMGALTPEFLDEIFCGVYSELHELWGIPPLDPEDGPEA